MFSQGGAVSASASAIQPTTRPDRIDSILKWSLITIIGTAVVCCVGLLVDDREVLGDPVWLKPLKFSISIALYTATFRWVLNRLPRGRMANVAAVVGTLGLVVEEGLVGLQAARAVRSHFNGETSFDSSIYTLMAIFVGLVFLAGVALAWTAFRRPPHDPVIRPMIRGGSLVMVLGMAVGIVMTSMPPSDDLPKGIVGAHSIGGLDGSGNGLPIVGWNTTFGDFRPAHFLGLHALQALIVIAAVGRRRGWTTDRLQRVLRAVTIVLGVGTVLLTVQALASTPITDRSSLILLLFGALAIGVAGINRPPVVPSAA
jgi:hypothetical protein